MSSRIGRRIAAVSMAATAFVALTLVFEAYLTPDHLGDWLSWGSLCF